MNRVPLYILVALLSAGVWTPVSAHPGHDHTVATATSVSINVNAGASVNASTSGLQKIKEEVRDQIKDAKNGIASTTANLKEKIEVRLEKRLEKMIERYQATIDRENSILKRIDSRITKVKNAGGKTEISEKFSLEAKTEIGLATTSLATLKSTIISIDNSTTTATSTPGQVTKDNINKLKKVSAEIEKHIRLAHKAMVNAIINLKGMSSVNATSSTEANVQN